MESRGEGGRRMLRAREWNFDEEEREREKERERIADVNSHNSSVNQMELIEQPPRRLSMNTYVLKSALVASICPVILGFEMGVLSETMITLQKDLELSNKLVEFSTVIIHIFALVGSVIAGRSADSIGRRLTIFSVGIIFFCVPFLMGLASTYSAALLGRLLAQVGVGYTLTMVPLYLAEVSPAFSRGFYTCFPEVFINTGVIIGYAGHYIFSKMKLNGWVVMLWEALTSLTLLSIALCAMPESPRWLILKGRLREARSVLCWTSGSIQESECQYTKICYAANIPESQFEEDIVSVQRSESNTWRDLLHCSNPSVMHMTVCAIMIRLAQKSSGCDTIVLYLPRILEKAGVVNINEKVLWILLIDLLKTVCVVIAALLLDRYGRRKLLLISIGGMVVSLVTLGSCLMNIDDTDKNRIDPNKKKELWVSQICIVSLFFYVGSFSIGMGPVASVFISELFPLELRAKGCSTAYAVNQGASALVSLIFFLLNKPISLGGAVFSFAVAAMGAWLFFFVTMPETKGFSLEEMLRLFGPWIQQRFVLRVCDVGLGRTMVRGDQSSASE